MMKATIEIIHATWKAYQNDTMANSIAGVWGSVVAFTQFNEADLDKWIHTLGGIGGLVVMGLSISNLMLARKERVRRSNRSDKDDRKAEKGEEDSKI